ncbi:anaerobic ribonucleoside-triphosphate reductase activating protein [Georgenia sp. M64]|uniref:anaerobic ribonucleoside-triphosphate reductase activating protein n=1 Tax=Georgenia sp. M64 TaxID=3120520 RepID=UPI0030E0FB80
MTTAPTAGPRAAGRPVVATGAGGGAAASLQVAGLSRLSTVDWPGRLAATVFLQGCPWDCVYCHNPDLIPPRTPGAMAWAEVMRFLARRRGLLDAVVLSGGEATRQPGLVAAVTEVRALGLAVGLHTAGAYPRRLAAVLPLVDWVGLDVKALPEDYPALVRRAGSGDAAWESLDLVLAAGVDHEVRTTIHPGSPATTHAVAIARRCRDLGVRSFALQQARETGARPFPARAPGWDDRAADLAEEIEALGFEEFTYRSA